MDGGRTTPQRKNPCKRRGFHTDNATQQAKARSPRHTNWRRGELTPCPKTTQVAASTCLVWCFVVETRGDHRQPPRVSNRLCLASRPTVESKSQPAILRPSRHRLRGVPRRAFY